MPAYLARTGPAVFAQLLALTLLAERPAAGLALVASAIAIDLPGLREIGPRRSAPPSRRSRSPASRPRPRRGAEAPAAAVIAVPARDGAIILASWYGPGSTATGPRAGRPTGPSSWASLPCGTQLTLTHGSRPITVPVIDRGPHVAGRTIDLSIATKLTLGCTDLCTLRTQIGR